jgi:hypothetical protein
MPWQRRQKEWIMTKSSLAAVVLGAVIAIAANWQLNSLAADNRQAAASAEDLRVPDGYQTSYEFLGAWAAAAEQGPGSQELHVVYASPGTIAAYRKDGHFPDGTILVKEVYRAATNEMTTGTISHADTLRGWFVMIRDSQGRHGYNTPLWGDGWGWAWFDAGDRSTPSLNLPLPGGGKANSIDYRENCKSCHLPAQASQWIYVEGYPPLKR